MIPSFFETILSLFGQRTHELEEKLAKAENEDLFKEMIIFLDRTCI